LIGECQILDIVQELIAAADSLFDSLREANCDTPIRSVTQTRQTGECVWRTLKHPDGSLQGINAACTPRCFEPFPGVVNNPVMAEILLFHHAQGETPGFVAFANELRAAGHTVHAPDLYEGRTFATLDEGVGYAKQVGFDTILERCRFAAEGLPNELVYAGFSLGVMGAQMLAQTRSGARGALLFSAAFPASEFGGSWPPGVPLQIHMMDADEWATEDVPAARELVRRSGARSCSCIPAIGICSLTTACPTTTKVPRSCSSNACLATSTTSSRCDSPPPDGPQRHPGAIEFAAYTCCG